MKCMRRRCRVLQFKLRHMLSRAPADQRQAMRQQSSNAGSQQRRAACVQQTCQSHIQPMANQRFGMDQTGLDCWKPRDQAGPEETFAGDMQGSIEDKFQTLQAQRTSAAVDNVPDTDADGKPLTKKARAALIRAAEQVQTVSACSNSTLFNILSRLDMLL